jgi:hypothetical protein
MFHTPEARDVPSNVTALSKGTSAYWIKPVDDEAGLRRLFRRDPGKPPFKDRHVGLVDIFDAPQDTRIIRASETHP